MTLMNMFMSKSCSLTTFSSVSVIPFPDRSSIMILSFNLQQMLLFTVHTYGAIEMHFGFTAVSFKSIVIIQFSIVLMLVFMPAFSYLLFCKKYPPLCDAGYTNIDFSKILLLLGCPMCVEGFTFECCAFCHTLCQKYISDWVLSLRI